MDKIKNNIGKYLFSAAWICFIIFMINISIGRFLTPHGEDLIGKKAPAIVVSPVDGFEPVPTNLREAKHSMFLLNFFATWCAPCRKEHPQLIKLSRDYQINIIGVASRNSPNQIADFLKDSGNPYAYVGIDKMDSTAVNYQLKGLPESYLFNRKGEIVAFHSGIITEEILEQKFAPHLQQKTKKIRRVIR